MNRIHPRLDRTSPKGEKFIGRCPACGKENLTFEQAREPCDGIPMTQDDALLGALFTEGKQ